MKKQLLYTLLLVLPHALNSQSFEHSNSWNNSLANSNIADTDFWNLKNNPAAAVYNNKLNIGIDVSNRFLIEDVNSALALGNININKNNKLVLSLSTFGNEYYNQNKASIAYALKLSNKLSSALQLCGTFNKIYSEEIKLLRFSPAMKLVVFYKINEFLNISSAYLLESHPAEYSNKLTQEISFGASYLLDERVQMFYQASYKNSSSTKMAIGLLVRFNEKISAQIGVKNNDLSLSFGASFQIKSIRIVSSFSYQHYLGFSPSVSIQKTFN